MDYERLQAIVGTALVDSSFRRRLLGGSYEVLNAFDLTPQEMSAVKMIRADSLQEFASELHQWMVRQTAAKVLAASSAPLPIALVA